jgi:hypothetical protein
MTRPHKADPGIARWPTIWRGQARVQKSFGSIGDKANVSSMFNKGNIVSGFHNMASASKSGEFHDTLAEP